MNERSILLRTERLSKSFGHLEAVRDVSLDIGAGVVHSIIGPNGAGKTTLFNVISGSIRPTAGSIYLRDREITNVSPVRHAKLGMGRSFQTANVFPRLTVYENVRLAAYAVQQGRSRWGMTSDKTAGRLEIKIAQALDEVGIRHRAGHVASILPHGDKRKLELALLLAQDVEIFLLDEPTAGLTLEDIPAIMDLIERLQSRGCTIVLVEHNIRLVMNVSNRISVMHQGEIIAEGPPEAVAANLDVQATYLGRPSSGL